MATVTTKFNVGDQVWAVHKYPAGARVYEGKIFESIIRIREHHNPEIMYKITSWPMMPLPESMFYATEKEAVATREEYLENTEVKRKRK